MQSVILHWKGTAAAACHQVVRTVTNPTYSNVRGTLHDEAVSEAVKADGATLLVQVNLLFRQEVSNPAACTQSGTDTTASESYSDIQQDFRIYNFHV